MAAANEFRSAARQSTVARSAASMARRTPPGALPAMRATTSACSTAPVQLMLLDLVAGRRRAFLVGVGRINDLAKSTVCHRNLGRGSSFLVSLGRRISAPGIRGAVALAAGRFAVSVLGNQVVYPVRAQV